MSTFFWPKVAKKCQKSRNSRFPISTVRKLLSEVEPYRTINNEVDVAKKCCQIWQKVAKVAKKCYQELPRPPTGSHGVPTGGFKGDSKGKCYRMWKKVTKGVPRDMGSSACLRCWPEGPAPKAPSLPAEGRQAS